MTRFHDLMLATTPVVFVPFDAPGDTTTSAQNLASGGGVMQAMTSSVNQAAAEPAIGFSNETDYDGADYWQADSTLFNIITTASSASYQDGITFAAWWRTTISDSTIRYVMRLDPWGMGIRRSFGNMLVEFYDITNTLRQVSWQAPENNGGWNMSFMVIDPAEPMLIVGINGWRLQDLALTSTSSSYTSIRTSGSTTFALGRNPSNGFTNPWIGHIGPIMVWDRALSVTEMQDAYMAAFEVQDTRTRTMGRFPEQRMRSDAVIERTTPNAPPYIP